MAKPVTIAELSEYQARAEEIFSQGERLEIIDYLAWHPRAGVVVQGTGGMRKLRWRRGNTGKRGGARIIYYFHAEWMPLYLITAYAKGDQADLSREERNGIARNIERLVNLWLEE